LDECGKGTFDIFYLSEDALVIDGFGVVVSDAFFGLGVFKDGSPRVGIEGCAYDVVGGAAVVAVRVVPAF